MKQLIAVKIIHDIKNRLVFNLYAEFFRLMGVYVGEGIINEYTSAEMKKDLSCFQIFFCVSDYSSSSEYGGYLIREIEDMVYIDATGYIFKDGMNIGAGLQNCMLEDLARASRKAVNKEVQFSMDLVKQILPVYLDCNVLKGSLLLQYYRFQTDIHSETQCIFEDALYRLSKTQSPLSYNENYYLSYAKLFCKQKVNLSCYYQKDAKFEYDIEDLSKECREFAREYADFSNAKVLLGMILEVCKDYDKYAVETYLEAIRQEKNKCYAAQIYHWIGKIYEKYPNCHEDAKEAYVSADYLKKKYRNVYKLAKMAGQENDHRAELKYYEECLGILDNRRGKRMDPLEIEYYFKTGVLASYECIMHLRDYNKAKIYGERTLKFYSEDIGTDFSYFFGSESNKFENITLSRIRLKKVYQCLAVAYRETGDLEKSEEYWKLAGN